MVFVSENIVIADKTYNVTDESKAAEINAIKELIKAIDALRLSR